MSAGTRQRKGTPFMNASPQHGSRQKKTPESARDKTPRPGATADPEVDEERANERVRATVKQAASNPESDESLREAAQENSQRAVTGRHREGVEAARATPIAAAEPLDAGLTGARVSELAEGETLIPGLVVTRVHVNEPGRTAWEGFATATRAAAAGGVTTMVDMPLNSVPATVNVPALEYERLFAAQNAFVDIGFWGGAVPGNKEDLRPRTMTACTTSSASCCTPGWTSSPTWRRTRWRRRSRRTSNAPAGPGRTRTSCTRPPRTPSP